MLNAEAKQLLNSIYGKEMVDAIEANKESQTNYADTDSLKQCEEIEFAFTGRGTVVTIAERYTLFIHLLSGVKRKGLVQFIKWLKDETDFFIAPASTKYHGAEIGGLLKHSLSVYKNLLTICQNKDIPIESIAITSLFHDVCKANFYTTSTRNVKNDETGVWEKKPYYTVDEELPFGSHGGKSVYLLMAHGLELTEEEAVAINCHMGGWDYTTYHNPSGAYQKYPLAVYLHIADMLATYIDKQ